VYYCKWRDDWYASDSHTRGSYLSRRIGCSRLIGATQKARFKRSNVDRDTR
jgi:hypothetical protein